MMPNSLLRMKLLQKNILFNKIVHNCFYGKFIADRRHIFSGQTLRNESKDVNLTFHTSEGKQVKIGAKTGDRMMEVVRNNIDLGREFGACGGAMGCGTCHVIFDEDCYKKAGGPSFDESDILDLIKKSCNTSDIQSISLAGCGFLGSYLIGALDCLKKYSPHTVSNAVLCGASMGALVAACEACDVPLTHVRTSVNSAAIAAHKYILGPFSPSYSVDDLIRASLLVLPSDAHVRCNGRLAVSITERKRGRNVLVTEWKSRSDLIECLICSCFIPLFSGTRLPVYRGIKCLDGGFSCNLPVTDGPAITISPFYDKSDISPKDDPYFSMFINTVGQTYGVSRDNFVRLVRTVYPPDVDHLDELYSLGYCHAMQYLINRAKNSTYS